MTKDKFRLNLRYEDEGEIIEEVMDINFSMHSIIRVSRVLDRIGNIPDIQRRIIFLLEQIPRFLLEEVKVGETIAVFDWFTHSSFVLNMDNEKINVITLFDEANHAYGKSLKMFEGEKFVEFSANDIVYGVFTKYENRTICDN